MCKTPSRLRKGTDMANTTKRSCNALGVCQGRVPACNDCGCTTTTTTDALDAWAINVLPHTDCPVCTGDEGCIYGDDSAYTPSSMDSIYYWGAVGLALVMTICVAFGFAGFATVK